MKQTLRPFVLACGLLAFTNLASGQTRSPTAGERLLPVIEEMLKVARANFQQAESELARLERSLNSCDANLYVQYRLSLPMAAMLIEFAGSMVVQADKLSQSVSQRPLPPEVYDEFVPKLGRMTSSIQGLAMKAKAC